MRADANAIHVVDKLPIMRRLGHAEKDVFVSDGNVAAPPAYVKKSIVQGRVVSGSSQLEAFGDAPEPDPAAL